MADIIRTSGDHSPAPDESLAATIDTVRALNSTADAETQSSVHEFEQGATALISEFIEAAVDKSLPAHRLSVTRDGRRYSLPVWAVIEGHSLAGETMGRAKTTVSAMSVPGFVSSGGRIGQETFGYSDQGDLIAQLEGIARHNSRGNTLTTSIKSYRIWISREGTLIRETISNFATCYVGSPTFKPEERDTYTYAEVSLRYLMEHGTPLQEVGKLLEELQHRLVMSAITYAEMPLTGDTPGYYDTRDVTKPTLRQKVAKRLGRSAV